MDSDGQYLNAGANAQYVGIEACQDCHADKYATYRHTGMGMSFKAASLSKSVADWSPAEPVHDPHRDLYYEPFHAGEDLFVREYRLENGDTVHVRIERVDYIVGSGHHTNSHIMNVNGYLYQVPITWYAQEGRWDLPPGFDEGNNSRFSREIPLECMTCHNARPTYVPHSGNRFTYVPEGIDCEQCHGPGSIHVERMEAGDVVDTSAAIDYSIVNPRRLPMDLQFDVCQRCHMQGMAVVKGDKTFLDFRPSTPLDETLNVYWSRHSDSLSNFIMASHPDRLKMSPCFVGSHEQGGHAPMTCVTCHNPHVSVRVTGPDTFNRACAGCHTSAHDNLCTADANLRASTGDDCASCHMPISSSIDIPHVTITDHYIRVVEEVSSEAVESTREFLGIASLVDDDPSPLNIALGYLTYFEQFDPRPELLDSAATYLSMAAPDTPSRESLDARIRLAFLQGRFEEVRRLAGTASVASIRDPWTLYRIGESHLRTGNVAQAVDYLERTVGLAPDNLSFRTKLGNAYAQLGNAARAIAAYNAVLEANPRFEEAYNNRGFVRLAQGELDAAEADFKQALSLDPDAEQALANLTSLFYNTGRADEARGLLERLLRIAPENPQYQQLDALLGQ